MHQLTNLALCLIRYKKALQLLMKCTVYDILYYPCVSKTKSIMLSEVTLEKEKRFSSFIVNTRSLTFNEHYYQ